MGQGVLPKSVSAIISESHGRPSGARWRRALGAKPRVERSGTLGKVDRYDHRAPRSGTAYRKSKSQSRRMIAGIMPPAFAGSLVLLVVSPGFRCAPPWAPHLTPRRRRGSRGTTKRRRFGQHALSVRTACRQSGSAPVWDLVSWYLVHRPKGAIPPQPSFSMIR